MKEKEWETKKHKLTFFLCSVHSFFHSYVLNILYSLRYIVMKGILFFQDLLVHRVAQTLGIVVDELLGSINYHEAEDHANGGR